MKPSAIERLARFGRDPFALLIVILAGLGIAHILVRTASYGAAVGTDSTLFLSTAMSFLAGEGWRSSMGGAMVEWPPLFPLLLAAGGWVGIELLEVGRLLNATAFGLTILAAGLYLRSNLQSRGLALAATGAIAASLPLSDLASNLLTEPIFVLFALLALLQLASFLQRGGRTPLLWGAVCTALAALTRWPGVVLIGTGVLLLLVRRTPPLATRLQDAAVFAAISSLPLVGVLTYNRAIHETWTGRDGGTGQSLSAGLSQMGDVFRKWVIPQDALDGLGYLLWTTTRLGVPDWFGSLLLATTGLVVVAMATVIVVSGRGGKDWAGAPLLGLEPALPFGVFALAYLLFIVAIVPFTVYQPIYSRFLLPVHIPLLLAAVFLLDRFLSIEVAGRRAAAKWGLASLVLLGILAHIGFSAQRNLRLTAQALESGYLDGTYNTAYWQHSAALNYTRSNRMDGKIYSNNSFLVWFANRTVVYEKHWRLPYSIRDWTRVLRQRIEEGEDVHIVWIKDDHGSGYFDYDDRDLRLLPGVEVVAESPDGVVFRATTAAAEPFDADRHRAQKERYVEQSLEQAGERVVRSSWDVYRTGRKLTYFKKPCTPADTQAKFILHVTPADPGVLPFSRKRYGFDNLGFHFDRRGIRVGDLCMVIAQLPDYAIGRIRVGQWSSNGNRTLWEAVLSGAGD